MGKVTTNSVGGQSFYKKTDLVKNVGTVAIRTLPTVKRTPVVVGNSFQELQVPEVAMFGESAFQKLKVPEVAMFGSEFQKLQVPEMSMFGDSACGADPEVMPSGVRPVEQVLKRPSGIRPVEQALKSYDDWALSSGDEGIDDFGFETITATPPTRTSIPPTLAPTSEAVKSQVVKDRPNLGSGIPVMGGAKNGKELGGNVVTKKLSYKDVVTAKSAVELREKKVCIGGRALREAPHVSHGGVAQVPVTGTAVSSTGQVPLKGTSAHKKLGTLGIVVPQGLNVVSEDPEWGEIEMAVDSGASESVVNEGMLNGVETLEGPDMKRGIKYEVADGTLIPNLGEKKYEAVCDAGVRRHMRSQVCDVNRALLSVHRCVQAGNRVVFAASGSYIEDEASGEVMPLREQGGMYMLKLWVKNQSFGGQADKP